MKKLTITFLNLIGCSLLCGTFTSTALANHRSGDWALPENMASGDFNGDGNLDLAVNLSGFDNFGVLTGSSTGDFTLIRHVEEDTLPKDVAVGDVDGDGRLDVVSIAQWGYDIRVYLGDGKGGFQQVSQFNGDGDPNRVVLADLNKDGKLDILANAPGEGKLLIYFGVGGGRFTNTALEIEGYPNLYSIATGDFNEDSNVDIAITYWINTGLTGSHMQILLGDGQGNFTPGVNLPTNAQPNQLTVADLNHDGHSDLLVGGAGSENDSGVFINSFIGDGKGNFTLHQTTNIGVGSIKGQWGVADFNEDGNVDIAFPLSSNQQRRGDFSTDLLMFMGDGTGNFTQGQTVTVGREPGSALPGDFNKDGHVDLVETNRTDGTLSVLFGNGDGTFVTHATISLCPLCANNL